MTTNTSQLLRFTTAGNVDDGKSTLIGRLLYDSKALFEDQLEAVETTSRRKGIDGVDLALFTDGLRDEREQGITIDVAYRYFNTPRRKFIIADTPGHIQYTRNMITGASTANAALILVDARKGISSQTRRHAMIAALLQIPHLIFCINKMDLVDYDARVFETIAAEIGTMASRLEVKDIQYIPISALEGDNVVHRSEAMAWYQGPSLLQALETLPVENDGRKTEARFPVQTVIRPQSKTHPDYRAYAGRVAGGIFKPGDRVTVLPSGLETVIAGIDTFGGSVDRAFPPMSVAIRLRDDLDVSRGDMLVKTDSPPETAREFDAMICWLHNAPARPRTRYSIMHTTSRHKAVISEVAYKIDINTYEQKTEDKNLTMNDIAKISLRTTRPVFYDSYRKNRNTGSFILIDDATNETVAAGMILGG